MKYFLIAGEASGDLHGSNLIRGLMMADSEAVIACRGGDLMEKAGGRLLTHYRSTAFMGFWEVVKNIGRIVRSLSECQGQIREFKPDLIILIDYPGFNLRVASFGRKLGIPVYWYISPKIWAWKEGRIKRIKRDVSRMYTILPFEKQFFDEHGYSTYYFGNPLVDELEKLRPVLSDRGAICESLGLEHKPVIALLPGSREQEVRKILPAMVSVVKYYHDYQFIIAASSNIDRELYTGIIGLNPVRVLFNKTYEILAVAEAALVKSGTSTLEAALIGTPQVVCYRAGTISYLIARMLVRIRFISLVNLLMDKEIVKELIQGDLNDRMIVKELNSLVRGGWKRDLMKRHYDQIRAMLGTPGVSGRVAADMVLALREKKG
ncbi:MAG: lipid-A-disaccharide synthase [Bacteroidales bacterium]|jgi:lipid-A-disaccharide synthase|nr:lipid-A-disaccharide synthase [Bacteroidales bacterium]